jgi:hypothetical protein
MGVLKNLNLIVVFFIFTVMFNLIVAGFYVFQRLLSVFYIINVLIAIIVVITSLKTVFIFAKMPTKFIDYIDRYFNAVVIFAFVDFILSLIWALQGFGEFFIELILLFVYIVYVVGFKLYFMKSSVINRQLGKNIDNSDIINIKKIKNKEIL